jgi:hypothetical protein
MARVSPHCVTASVIYYHLKVRSSLPNYKWTNNIIDSATPPIY